MAHLTSAVRSKAIEIANALLAEGHDEGFCIRVAIARAKEWGRRRLQFPIRDSSEGIYHILRFNLDQSQLPELHRYFRLNEQVLRHLVIRDEGTPLDHVGQVSESEEHRDSRDRRHGPPPRRFDETQRTPRPVSEPAAVTVGAEVGKPASEQGSGEDAGEERSSE